MLNNNGINAHNIELILYKVDSWARLWEPHQDPKNRL